MPANALAPPKPTGPTMSGGLPPAISVGQLVVGLGVDHELAGDWMSVCEALKSSMTFVSTATCSGASPVPRQQYQRMTLTPGGTDSGATITGVGDGYGGSRRLSVRLPPVARTPLASRSGGDSTARQ